VTAPRPRQEPGIRRRPGERGFALLLTLLLTMIAIVIISDLSFQAGLEYMAAANVSDLEVIEYSVDGQFELALALLQYDAKSQATNTDSEFDEWNSKDKRSRTDGDVQLSQRIFDECGKFNVSKCATGNEAQQARFKKVLKRILATFRPEAPTVDGIDYHVSDVDADDLASRIVDYLKREGSSGQVPRPNTSPKGVPLLLDELVFADPKRMPYLLRDVKVQKKVYPGLHRYLTCYGAGKVNLNTAPLLVLQAYFDQDRDAAKAIFDRRNSTPEETTGSTSGMSSSTASPTGETTAGNPYTDVNQVTKVEGVTQEVLTRNGVDVPNDFDVRSDYFAIWIQGSTERTQRNELYVVQRVKADGFVYLLHQERVDPLLAVAEDTESGP
jgi:type II secretory pathway component PulK